MCFLGPRSNDINMSLQTYLADTKHLTKSDNFSRRKELRPREVIKQLDVTDITGSDRAAYTNVSRSSYEAPKIPVSSSGLVSSVPLQIWEGTILEVDEAAGIMRVRLDAKLGQDPQHTADIGLEWVSDQDKSLVRPGAVFYLTLYKMKTHGSVKNSQELRFRRRPSWSDSQLKRIERDTWLFMNKMKRLEYEG